MDYILAMSRHCQAQTAFALDNLQSCTPSPCEALSCACMPMFVKSPSLIRCRQARADVALSVAMTTVSTLLAVAATPLLTKLLVGQLVPVSVGALLLSTLQVLTVNRPTRALGLLGSLLTAVAQSTRSCYTSQPQGCMATQPNACFETIVRALD